MIPGFGLDVTQGTADAVVRLTGEFDVATAPQLSGLTVRSPSPNPKKVLEIAGLTQISAVS